MAAPHLSKPRYHHVSGGSIDSRQTGPPPCSTGPVRMIPVSPHTSFQTSFHQPAVAFSGGPEHRSPVSGISQQFLTGSPKMPKSSRVQAGCGEPGGRQVPLQEQVSSPRQHWRLQRLHGVPRSSQQLYTMPGPGAAQEGMGPAGSKQPPQMQMRLEGQQLAPQVLEAGLGRMGTGANPRCAEAARV